MPRSRPRSLVRQLPGRRPRRSAWILETKAVTRLLILLSLLVLGRGFGRKLYQMGSHQSTRGSWTCCRLPTGKRSAE